MTAPTPRTSRIPIGYLVRFLIHVRYWGAFIIVYIGMLLSIPGEIIVKLGKWIGSKE